MRLLTEAHFFVKLSIIDDNSDKNYKEVNMTYGQKVLKLRKALRLTQAELGKKLNISARTASDWDDNLYEPDIASIKTMAALLGTSTDAFLDADVPVVVTQKSSFSVPRMIGVCSECGYAVYEDNLGQKSPLMCTDCVMKATKQREIQNEQRRLEYKTPCAILL